MITNKKLEKLKKIYKAPINYATVLFFSLRDNKIFGFYIGMNRYLLVEKDEFICSNTIKKLLFSEDQSKIELALNLI